MIWNYRVVKQDNNYCLRITYYDKNTDTLDMDHVDSVVDEVRYCDDDIIGVDIDQENISIDSDFIDIEGGEDIDKEAVRDIVKILYMMIDDIKESKVLDMENVQINFNGLIK
jgi:hypothetical protein